MGSDRELVDHAVALETRIDDLSRELTEEIEAHRVTRERMEYEKDRAQKASADCVLMQSRAEGAEYKLERAEARVKELEAVYMSTWASETRLKVSKAALIAEIREWLCTPRTGPLDGLSAILAKHEGEQP